jgi:hypothetical protein
MTFLQSSALWGLLALALPVLIHFLSSNKRTKIPLGTIRFLETASTTSSRSLQLSQIPLLLSRILLLTTICLIMAKPAFNVNKSGLQYWVEDRIVNNEDYQSILSQLSPAEDLNIFSFTSDSTEYSIFFRSGWQMIEHLNHSKDSITVYSLSELRNFKGSPIPISSRLNWITLPQDEVVNSTDKGYQIISNHQNTRFIKSEQSIAEIQSKGILNICNQDSSEHIKNLIENLSEYLPYSINWTVKEDQADWVILSSTRQAGQTSKPTLIYRPSGESLSIKKLAKDHYSIFGAMDIEQIMSSNLPVLIASILNQNYVESDKYDHRQINPLHFSTMYEAQKVKADSADNNEEIPRRWYLILIPLLFLERTLSLMGKRKSI